MTPLLYIAIAVLFGSAFVGLFAWTLSNDDDEEL